jgi:hypothetical protein
MALSKAQGTFDCPASIGNYSVTGLSFRPEAVIFLTVFGTILGGEGTFLNDVGAMDSSGNEFAIANYSQNTRSTFSNTSRYSTASKCFVSIENVGVLMDASFVSMNSDGFTINFGAVASGRKIAYIALAGADFYVGNYQVTNSVTTQSVTGVGFQPDALFHFTVASPSLDTVIDSSYMSIGLASGSSNQFTQGTFSGDNTATSITKRTQSNSDLIIIPASASTFVIQASLDSFDSDGFTIDITDAATNVTYAGFLAIGNVQAYVGNDSLRTTVGTKATTGVGFEPEVGFFTNSWQTTANSTIGDSNISNLGVAVSSSDQVAINTYDQNNVSTTNNNRYLNTGRVIVSYTGSIVYNVNLDSFDSDGFTLDVDVTGGSAHIFGYLMLSGKNTLLPINLTLKFDVHNSVSKEFISKFDIFNSVSKEAIFDFDVKNTVSQELISKFDVRAIAAKELIAKFDILSGATQVSKELVAKFDVHGTISKEMIARYDVHNIVSKEGIYKFDIHNSVEKELIAKFDIKDIASQELIAVYDMGGTVSKEFICVFDIKGSGGSGMLVVGGKKPRIRTSNGILRVGGRR